MEEQDQLVSTPQGSPVSLVLSALYMSPLVKIPIVADGCSLGMYVDDGVIFAQGKDWATVFRKLTAQYQVCEDWLRCNNLAIKPDKSELICFRTPHACKASLPPDRLFLLDTARNTYYRVSPKATVWYLGFFLNQKLDCTHLVIYRPGFKARSQPKTDFRSWCRTGPRVQPHKAHGWVFSFGMWLPRAHFSGFTWLGHTA